MRRISAMTASMAAEPLRRICRLQFHRDARAHDGIVALQPFGMRRCSASKDERGAEADASHRLL